MLFIALLVVHAFAKDIICDNDDGTFTWIIIDKCMNRYDGTSERVVYNGDFYIISTYRGHDCNERVKVEPYIFDQGCLESEVPDYIAYFQPTWNVHCNDAENFMPTIFFKEGCFKVDSYSVKYEFDGVYQFIITTFPDNTNCEDSENKQVKVEKDGRCTLWEEKNMRGWYRCGE